MLQISPQFFTICLKIRPIIQHLETYGAHSYLVGGSVRDLVSHREIKDIDIEVHNITSAQLEASLRTFGSVFVVGKFFGVF